MRAQSADLTGMGKRQNLERFFRYGNFRRIAVAVKTNVISECGIRNIRNLFQILFDRNIACSDDLTVIVPFNIVCMDMIEKVLGLKLMILLMKHFF